MKTLEKVFLAAQALIFILALISGSALIIGVTVIGLPALNIGIKLYNMYRMEPKERQEHREEGGSGIWC